MLKKLSYLALSALVGLTTVSHAEARRGEQTDAREDVRKGQVKSLRELESMVLPQMRGMQYLGPDWYNGEQQMYRLRFIDRDRVVFVEVDARSGRILSRR